MLQFLVAAITTITLVVTPTAGKSPLTLNLDVTITGPADGYVCIGVHPKGKPEDIMTLGCRSLLLTETEMIKGAFITTGGAPHTTYTFQAFVMEKGKATAAAIPVDVVTDPDEASTR